MTRYKGLKVEDTVVRHKGSKVEDEDSFTHSSVHNVFRTVRCCAAAAAQRLFENWGEFVKAESRRLCCTTVVCVLLHTAARCAGALRASRCAAWLGPKSSYMRNMQEEVVFATWLTADRRPQTAGHSSP